jgi:hypothetical protein
MGWDLAGCYAEACSCELTRINVLGTSHEGGTGLSTAMYSWVA